MERSARCILGSTGALLLLTGTAMPASRPSYEIRECHVITRNPGGMPALCRAGNGDLLLAYATNWQPIPPAGGCVKLMRSGDDGRTWSEPRIVVRPKDPKSWSAHMWSGLHRMPDGTVILAYGQNHSEDVAALARPRSDVGQARSPGRKEGVMGRPEHRRALY